MVPDYGLLAWIVLLPLAGAALLGLVGRKLPVRLAGGIATAAVGGSFLLGLAAFLRLRALAGQGEAAALTQTLYHWLAVGNFTADAAFLFDPLSAVMVLVVSGVSFLIHLYSIGYMADDRGYWRYFAYLNLFVFFMLLLVTASNIVLMFVGWEGVGLCSYLLIGFWYQDTDKAIAGKKAFIVNRIGDFGFLLGMILIFWNLGTVEFAGISARAESLTAGGPTALAICLLLFLGAAGKSAQLPLYVWLPDAMAGPTPVSALIHAATMVTAGVYMIARLNALYLLAPAAMAVVATVGTATALFAAVIALAQTDIKKVLAYSTISQLGYMFLAVGVGAFSAGIFHLLTHAFFKALLFLGAGSVMHALAGRTDIREMGGLRKALPVTYWTFLIAALAIAGIPPLSGFFSKDEILWMSAAMPGGSWLFWAVGLFTAGLTAFYMFRLTFLTFHGSFRGGPEAEHHLHESPPVMTIPLLALAALAALGGLIGVPESLGGSNLLHHWLAPAFGAGGIEAPEPPAYPHWLELGLILLTVAVAATGIWAAWLVYLRRPGTAVALARRRPILYRVVRGKFYVDELYNIFIVQPIKLGSTYLLWKLVDVGLIDGTVNLIARSVRGLGGLFARLQSGYAQVYAVSFLLGVALLLGSLLW